MGQFDFTSNIKGSIKLHDHVASTSGHPALLITSEVAQAFKAEYDITTDDLAPYVHGVKVELTRAADIQPSNGCWFGGQFVLNAGSSGYTALDKPAYVMQAIFKGSDTSPNGTDIHVGRFETQSAGKVSDIVHILANTGTTITGSLEYIAAHVAPSVSMVNLNAQSSITVPTGIKIMSGSGSSYNYGIDLASATINTADIRFQGGTTLLDDGTDLTLAGANLVLGAGLTLGSTLDANGNNITNVGDLEIDGTTTALTFSGAATIVAGSGLTMPAFTLGGAVEGGNQNLNKIGHLGLANTNAATYTIIYANETFHIENDSYREGWESTVKAYITEDDFTDALWGIYSEVVVDELNTQDWTDDVGLRGIHAKVSTEGNATGTVTGAAALYVDEGIGGVADKLIVTNYYGLYVAPSSLVGNSRLTNDYGIYIGDQAGGATLNYAIYTNAGLVRFGGATTIVGALTLGATELTATATELNLLDLAGMATGELLVATGATTAAWQSTGVVLSDPYVDDIIFIGNSNTTVSATAWGTMGVGIQIDQATADASVMQFLSTGDVAHGMTTLAGTSLWGLIRKASGVAGGLVMHGLTDADAPHGMQAIILMGSVGEAPDTEKSTSGRGVVEIHTFKKSGTSHVPCAASDNILAICAGGTAQYIFSATAGLWMTSGITVGGDIGLADNAITGLRAGTAAINPESAHRGQFYFTEGGTGIADKLYCIMKGTDDNYDAVQVAMGQTV